MCDKRTIGERLRFLRTRLGLKQSDVHKITGLAQKQISEHENNGYLPQIDAIKKYADCYKTTSDYIIGLSPESETRPMKEEPPGLAYFFERITEFLSPDELPLTAEERQALRGIPGHLTPKGYAHVIRTVRMVAERDNPNNEKDTPKQ